MKYSSACCFKMKILYAFFINALFCYNVQCLNNANHSTQQPDKYIHKEYKLIFTQLHDYGIPNAKNAEAIIIPHGNHMTLGYWRIGLHHNIRNKEYIFNTEIIFDPLEGDEIKVGSKKFLFQVDRAIQLATQIAEKGVITPLSVYHIGLLITFAVHLNDLNMRKDANRIVNILVTKFGLERIIFETKNFIADDKYLKIFNIFKRDKDWQKYGNSVYELLIKYKTCWRIRPAIDLLYERIKERQREFEVPKDVEDKLSPSNLTLLKKMPGIAVCIDPLCLFFDNKGLNVPNWLFVPCRKTGEQDKILDIIFKKGVDALPALIESVDISYLCNAIPLEACGESNILYKNSLDPQKTHDAHELYKKFDSRPMSIGEVSYSLLCFLNPNEKSLSNKKIKQITWDLYKALKGKSNDEIAQYYLRKKEFTGLLIDYLIKRDVEHNRMLIENSLLESVGILSPWIIINYIETLNHKNKNSKFLMRLKKLVLEKFKSELEREKSGARTIGRMEVEDSKKIESMKYIYEKCLLKKINFLQGECVQRVPCEKKTNIK